MHTVGIMPRLRPILVASLFAAGTSSALLTRVATVEAHIAGPDLEPPAHVTHRLANADDSLSRKP